MATTTTTTTLYLFITIFLTLTFSSAQNDTVSCPLNFNLIRNLVGTNRPSSLNILDACRYTRLGLQLVESEYLSRTNSFTPPPAAAESCWSAYQTLADDFFPNFDLRKNCGFQTNWISTSGCMNINNKTDFERRISQSARNGVVSACNQSLSGSACSACTVALSNLQAVYLNGESNGNLTDCKTFPFIYTAAFVNRFGPTDRGTAFCLFSLDFVSKKSNNKHKVIVIVIVVILVSFFALVLSIGLWYYRKKKIKEMRRRRRINGNGNEMTSGSALDAISGSTSLVKYTIDEIKEATRNFSRENIIGRGGYGNVYKGVLPDNTEVALKRFKNCSAAGDASFTHEVEVIASVRHVNLVALRGYCIATTQYEGYQRIIVCDLVSNGSLHDHLFGIGVRGRVNLTWPIRRKIALGTARGLAYLHYGAQPAIIHRDIKASNILLDENFEAKVADFGLAKFAPEGATHLSTRVAGTMGYVAPEYALYGQLTERSDVYSFGVVLLELLSGKKALLEVGDGQPVLLADWAWSMVRKGTPLEVIDSEMTECGSPEIMEKYVLAAVLSSHPQLYARPTMDQVLKMLDTDLPVPSIPERPIPLIAGLEDIERSISSSGSGQLSTPRGYQAYTHEMDGRSAAMVDMDGLSATVKEEEEEDDNDEDEKARLSSDR
uniref:probable LRR receptor-like serine/threonine-protein kinase RKF3 n=1 Tax=Erigeron canadensis TaxID=72917 RepID=UPI001CB9840C|nr:probable LRR receptor-like serine/threonine-protein kinase RKF3 [Erigeron canadensis]